MNSDFVCQIGRQPIYTSCVLNKPRAFIIDSLTSSLFVLVALVLGFEVFPFTGTAGVVDPVDFFHGFRMWHLLQVPHITGVY